MNTSTTITYHLTTLLEERMKHTFLNKHIKRPFIDEGKLLILSGIMEGTDISEAKKEKFIITAMLVQIALDTHDLVPSKIVAQESKKDKLEKQLRVLAGDYYSGLYYMLLSELEEIGLIHKFATAIKEINENKMRIYYHEANSLKEYMDLVIKTESLVAISLAEYVEDRALMPVIDDWLYVNKLMSIQTNSQQDFIPMIHQWQACFPDSDWTNTSIISEIDEIIKHKSTKINYYLSTLPKSHSFHGLKVEDSLGKLLHHNSSFAEEG